MERQGPDLDRPPLHPGLGNPQRHNVNELVMRRVLVPPEQAATQENNSLCEGSVLELEVDVELDGDKALITWPSRPVLLDAAGLTALIHDLEVVRANLLSAEVGAMTGRRSISATS